MSGVVQPLLYVAIFAIFFAIFQFVSSRLFASRAGARRINRRLDLLQAGVAPQEVYASLVRNPAGLNFRDQRLASLYGGLSNRLRQAGLRISPQRFIGLVAAGALGLWGVSLLVLRTSGHGDFGGNLISTLCGSLLLSGAGALAFVDGRRRTRTKRLEEQLPLALDIINRALRAGHPVVSAVQLASHEMADPIGSEFGLVVDETAYGAEFKDALANFARRTGSPDVHFFAISVSIQSETGGNLAEILEGLASVIRGRLMLGKRVKSLASEGRASATMLSVLPVLLVGGLSLLIPNYYTSKLDDPVFWPTVCVVGAMYIIGVVMFNRITNFKY